MAQVIDMVENVTSDHVAEHDDDQHNQAQQSRYAAYYPIQPLQQRIRAQHAGPTVRDGASGNLVQDRGSATNGITDSSAWIGRRADASIATLEHTAVRRPSDHGPLSTTTMPAGGFKFGDHVLRETGSPVPVFQAMAWRG
jgi:hypothetical protein